MLKALKTVTLNAIAGANVATIAIMLLTGFSDRVNPVDHPVLANAGLLFPVFVAINLLFLVFWLIVKWKYALIPFLGMLLAYAPVRTYFPLNIPRTAPEGALKVLSYNVEMFKGIQEYGDSTYPILDYIAKSCADIVCLQEAKNTKKWLQVVDTVMSRYYPYRLIKQERDNGLAVLSRYPIVGSEMIDYRSRANISMACFLLVKGDTVLVVNNHFESNNISFKEKNEFQKMVKGDLKETEAKAESHALLNKLAESVKVRAPQVDSVANYLRRHDHLPTIVCGDFNDNPISYSRHTLAKNLTDCYRETAFGPGYSYHEGDMYVRIDHLLCSSHWQPFAAYVDSKIAVSDHYPISCWLKMRPKR